MQLQEGSNAPRVQKNAGHKEERHFFKVSLFKTSFTLLGFCCGLGNKCICLRFR